MQLFQHFSTVTLQDGTEVRHRRPQKVPTACAALDAPEIGRNDNPRMAASYTRMHRGMRYDPKYVHPGYQYGADGFITE